MHQIERIELAFATVKRIETLVSQQTCIDFPEHSVAELAKITAARIAHTIAVFCAREQMAARETGDG